MGEATKAETTCLPLEPEWIRETLLECLQAGDTTEELKFVAEEEELCVTDVSAGSHMNNVLRVSSKTDPSKSVVIKHAPPYQKVCPTVPLTPLRGFLEFRVLQKFNTFLPGSVPKPLAYNRDRKVFCMQDLRGYVIYRKWLMAGNVDEDVARTLARNLATIHSETHVTNIGQDALQQLDEEFRNTLTSLTVKSTYEEVFDREYVATCIPQLLESVVDEMMHDEEVPKAAARVRRVFLERKDALVHGDVHLGSVMVKGSDVKMFDVEFARVGPCCKDLGQILSNYICSFFYHLHHPDSKTDIHRRMVETLPSICHATADEYLRHLKVNVADRDQFDRQFISEAAGFAGIEILLRLLTVSHFEDMDSMVSAQPDVLTAGCRLLKAHHEIHDIAAMMDVALNLTQRTQGTGCTHTRIET